MTALLPGRSTGDPRELHIRALGRAVTCSSQRSTRCVDAAEVTLSGDCCARRRAASPPSHRARPDAVARAAPNGRIDQPAAGCCPPAPRPARAGRRAGRLAGHPARRGRGDRRCGAGPVPAVRAGARRRAARGPRIRDHRPAGPDPNRGTTPDPPPGRARRRPGRGCAARPRGGEHLVAEQPHRAGVAAGGGARARRGG